MKCSKCKRLLIEFSKGQLTDELDQKIRRHLSDCGACRQEFYDLGSSLKLLNDSRNMERIPDPPGDFAGNVMSRIHQRDADHFPFRKLVFGVIAVCCLLGLGATLYFYSNILQEQSPVPESRNISLEVDAPDGILSVDRMKKKLVRILDQTIETIERGEQEWEVEI